MNKSSICSATCEEGVSNCLCSNKCNDTYDAFDNYGYVKCSVDDYCNEPTKPYDTTNTTGGSSSTSSMGIIIVFVVVALAIVGTGTFFLIRR